ncbi:MAG: threonine/serine exporter family protein [Liquorilactobacillus hordei]|uniref:threonine/serine exporter family protein n=1 Tax=Liquorilactobacillus hordei TaxID=468911 RepID=UPI0039EBE798
MMIVQIICSYLATIGFGIIVNIPHRALNACGWVGVLGWMTYLVVKTADGGTMLANALAALAIGLSSIFMARRLKMPMILFNIPSLVPLVPGGQAYKAVRSFAAGNDLAAIGNLVQVAMIAGAIAMGFFISELVARTYFRITMKH